MINYGKTDMHVARGDNVMRRKTNVADKFEVAERLKKIREGAGYTQERFAEVLEVSLSSYKKIECANIQISLEALRKLHQKLNVSADYILFGETPNPKEAWNVVLNCNDYDKMFLLLRLFNYFSAAKGEIFPDKKTAKRSDKRIEDFIDLLNGNLSK